jgi:hypothetical protein
MIFVALAMFGVALYFLDYKCPAFILFFFFLTNGFNLLSENFMDIGPISKGSDFALLMLVGMLAVDTFCIKDYWKLDRLAMLLLGLGAILMVCIVYSKFIVGASWAEIIRVSRYQFFWLLYFVFRNMEKKRLEQILRYLFNIILVVSCLYLLQIFIGKEILNTSMRATAYVFGMKLPRYYNQPLMLHFFALMAIYYNPYKGAPKIVTTVLLVAALLGAFHRSMLFSFILVVGLAYAVKLSRLRRVQFLSIAAALLAVVTVFKGVELSHSRTFQDLKNVAEGNINDIDDIDMEVLGTATFSFRMAILLERNLYILQRPITTLLGAGLLTEDSSLAGLFDFHIGLKDDITDEIIKTEIGDISYATLTLRMGYLGTAAYLAVLIYLTAFFYKHRDNKYALTAFLYWIFSFGVSFFSSNLLIPATYVVPLIAYVIVKKTDQEIPELNK